MRLTMTAIACRCWLLSSLPLAVRAAGEDLSQPPTISSADGVLNWTLSLEKATISTPDFTLTTRTFNGMLPGPTIRLRPGDTLYLEFENKLEDQGFSYRHNALSAPDESNVHFHGLHISGELPSDDTTHVVRPGESYSYIIDIPEDHMPGTSWVHPHRHGSATLHLSGGAVLAVVVEDPPGYLPPHLAEPREIIMVVQQLLLDQIRDVASDSKDLLFQFFSFTGTKDYITINGQYRPVVRLDPFEWVRMRVIFAAWKDNEDLDFSVEGCEMQLLAKDGIYLREVPRQIFRAPIPLGGRADIMVRCMGTSASYVIRGRDQDIGYVVTSSNNTNSDSLASWTPTFPRYLQNLVSATVDESCSCSTQFGSGAVNGRKFDEEFYLHYSYPGAVVERRFSANGHPYHQHVFPFQITEVITSEDSTYIAVGDWHDSFNGDAIMRYNTSDRYTGKVMVHCHRLKHEDQGMMTMEYVNATATTCVCGTALGKPDWYLPVVICSCILGFFLLIVLPILLWWARRTHRLCWKKKPSYAGVTIKGDGFARDDSNNNDNENDNEEVVDEEADK